MTTSYFFFLSVPASGAFPKLQSSIISLRSGVSFEVWDRYGALHVWSGRVLSEHICHRPTAATIASKAGKYQGKYSLLVTEYPCVT